MISYIRSCLLHRGGQVLDDGIKVLPVGLPLGQALLCIALELPVLVFVVSFCEFSLLQLSSEMLLPISLLLLHLPLQVFGILECDVLANVVVLALLVLQSANLFFPSLFELLVVLQLLLLFPLFFQDLIF